MEDDRLRILKFNLQEKQFPYFDDEDLLLLLELYPDINRASYEGCMIKAQDDSVQIPGITTPNNEQYWLRRAYQFKRKIKGFVTNMTGTVNRVDEIC